MSKKISVSVSGIFSIVDTLSNKPEFLSLAKDTFINKIGSQYYFYYDSFVIGDSISKSRSTSYPLQSLVGQSSAPFLTEQSLFDWAEEFLNVLPVVVPPFGSSSISGYVSEYNYFTLFIYSGFIKNSVPIIVRWKEGVLQTAQNVTNLSLSWGNKENLIYI